LRHIVGASFTSLLAIVTIIPLMIELIRPPPKGRTNRKPVDVERSTIYRIEAGDRSIIDVSTHCSVVRRVAATSPIPIDLRCHRLIRAHRHGCQTTDHVPWAIAAAVLGATVTRADAV